MGSKLTRFSIIDFPGAVVIGHTAAMPEPAAAADTTIEDLWAEMRCDGSLALLRDLPGRFTPGEDLAGWMGDWSPGAAVYTYLAGMLYLPGVAAPDGFSAREILPGVMAVGWVQETEGEEGGELHGGASALVGQARDAAGYTYDPSRGLFELELYTMERFQAPLGRGERVTLDFYTPCRKR